jgi:type IV pilus assembly protein PilM
MNLLPKSSGSRPRVACEISSQGVVAAKSADTTSPMNAVAKEELAVGALVPSLKPGNLVDRVAITAAVRRVMESIGMRPNSRGADITLVIPDTAVRVLLLEFDSLPSKLSEALPLVRFRLKKLLPFDADEAMVSFQVMSSNKTMVRVLAIAIPRDVLSDYETAVREAGFEPGAVLPSTLAAVAALEAGDQATLLVNASRLGITTAIVRGGVLLLHRTIDLQDHAAPVPPNLPPALFEPQEMVLPLVNREQSVAEWAAQEPLPEHGRNPYADRVVDEESVQNFDNITNLPIPPVLLGDVYAPATAIASASNQSDIYSHAASAQEIAQAVSVAAAYYEDTLSAPADRILSAGPLGASFLGQVLTGQGIVETSSLTVREVVESSALLSEAVTSSVPRGWLAGVMGALRG